MQARQQLRTFLSDTSQYSSQMADIQFKDLLDSINPQPHRITAIFRHLQSGGYKFKFATTVPGSAGALTLALLLTVRGSNPNKANRASLLVANFLTLFLTPSSPRGEFCEEKSSTPHPDSHRDHLPLVWVTPQLDLHFLASGRGLCCPL